jgi:hypothetical protein
MVVGTRMLNFDEMFSETHIVANTRSWSFIVKKLQKTVVVSSMMHTYSTTYYEAYKTGEMINLYPELVMIHNSNYHLKWLTPMITGQVCC